MSRKLSPGSYERLQHTMIVITFWNSQREVLPYFSSAQNDTMRVYIWELLLPHMTAKGLEVYKNISTDQTAVK